MRPPRAPLDPRPIEGLGISELALVRELCKRGQPGIMLAEFVAAAWHVVVGEPLKWSWHMQVLCDHLQAQLERGRFGKPKCPRLLINIPPGTSKSLILNVFAVAWHWTWAPQWSVICASANPRIVLRDSVKCRDLITSDWYVKTFAPKWKLADDQNAKGSYKNIVGGFRISMGAGSSGITGEHAAALFFDDLLDAAEAHSETSRDSINNWFDQAAGNRLNDLQNDTVTMIAQRLHEEDPPGHVIAQGTWEHLKIAMERELDERCKCHSCVRGKTFLGWTDPRKIEGEILDPVRFPLEVLKGPEWPEKTGGELKRLGEAGYAGQMQQHPSSAKGNMFKREWWRFYTRDKREHPRPMGATQLPARFLSIGHKWVGLIQSWDCAFKDLTSSDRVCGGVLGMIGADIFVLDLFWDQAGFTRTCDEVLRMRREWPASRTVLIEDKANGTAAIEVLGRKIPGVIAVEPEGGKEARAAAAVPTVEAGNVYLPEGAPWLEQWFDEFSGFPLSKHDDAVDMLSQAIRRLEGGTDAIRAAALLGMRTTR
jgi:predicted phage terminase large subunit-like protein